MTKVTEPTTNSGANVLNACTRQVYDSTYNLFVKEIHLPPNCTGVSSGFIVYQDWDDDADTGHTDDFRCGVPSKITDINGQVTTRTFDSLCRLTNETRPTGDFTQTNYSHMPVPGSPTTQYIETTRPAPASGSGTIWSRAYLDGFGRK